MRIAKVLITVVFGLVVAAVTGCNNNSQTSSSGNTVPGNVPAVTNASTNLPPIPGK